MLTSFVPALAEGPLFQGVSCTDYSGVEISDKIYVNAQSINAVFSSKLPIDAYAELYFVSDSGKEISLDCSSQTFGNVLRVYPERVLPEGKKHILKFYGIDSKNAEFTSYSEKEETYFYTDFTKNKSVSTFKSGGEFTRGERENVLSCKIPSNTVSSSSVDFYAKGIGNEDTYVLDTKIKINSLASCTVQLFDAKKSSTAWRTGNYIDANGNIYTRDGGISPKRQIGVCQKGVWVRYSVVYDVANMKSDVYLDGELASEDIPLFGEQRPETFRIDMVCKSPSASSGADVEVDYVKVYAGNTLKGENFGDVSGETCYYYNEFESIDNVIVAGSGAKFAQKRNSAPYSDVLSCKIPSNTASTSSVDFVAEGISQEDTYVIDAKIKVNALTSCTVQLFDAKESSTLWRTGNYLDGNGNIYTRDGEVSPKRHIGTLQKGEWIRYSVVYDVANMKSDIYLDGELASENIPLFGAQRPETFRIDMVCKSPSSASVADIEFDYVKIYSGNTLKGENYGAASGEACYYYNDFETIGNITVVGGGAAFSQKENTLLRGKVNYGVTSGACADIIAPAVKNAEKYVLDTKFKINDLSGGAMVQLFDAKDESATSWRIGNYLHSNGYIFTRDPAVSQVNIGSWKAGEWMRYSVVYDTKNMKSDVYLNGVLAKKDIPLKGCQNPDIFRIDLINKSATGSIDIDFEKIKIYGGDTLLPWENTLYSNDSIMEGEMDVKIIAGNSMVFSLVSDYYIKDGVRQKYPENIKPILSGENVILSPAFAKEFLSLDKSSNVTAEEAAKELSKAYVYDDRGFFVICDNGDIYKNSDLATLLFEKSDTLYRSVIFDNPRGEEVLHKLRETRGEEHPRILYTQDEISYIKSKIQNDNLWKNALRKIISDAENAINKEDYYAAEYGSGDKQNVARNFQDHITALAKGYMFTEKSEYAQTAVNYMLSISKWDSLNPEVSNLTTGHYAMGMAVGYDSFYNYINSLPEGEAVLSEIKDAVMRLCIAEIANTYRGGNWSSRWIKITDNFSGVCSGGMMAITLAFADEEAFKDDVVVLFENLLKTQSIAVSLYYPDGGYYEGIGYGEYSLQNLTLSIEALFKCCGTDFGLSRAKGFKESGEYFLYMQSGNRSFNYHDCSQRFTFSDIPLWFAYRYEKTDALKEYKNIFETYGFDFGVDGLFFYDKAFGSGEVNAETPLDRYFDFTGSGTFRNSFDVRNQTFAAFHGGFTGLPHDMLDLGQFVFESDGVHWAMDLGKDSYSIPGYFSNDGYKIYRKKTEGENCVVINPSVDASSYYGQKIGAKASLLFFDSEPSAAMAALDLTDAYSRDVTSYKRGYYFGDNRSTFLVQDEITLKNKSEIYWFMHSEADVEILDTNTAILTYSDKKMRAEVYCSDAFELKSLPATQLDETLKVSKQADDSYIDKLTVHCPQTEGNVTICVKLIPENDFVKASLSSPVAINNWTLPQGEMSSELKIRNQHVDENGKLVSDVMFPLWAEKGEVYVGDKKVQEFTPAVGVKYEFISSNPLNFASGSYNLKFIAKGQGREEESSCNLDIKNIGTKVFYENSLSEFSGANTTADTGRNIYAYGTYSNTEGALDIVSDMSGEDFFAYGAKNRNRSYGFSEGTVQMAFDVKFSSTMNSLVFECLNFDKNWFMAGEKIFNSGRLSSNKNYFANTWYRVKLIINFDNKLCKVYVKEATEENYDMVFCKKIETASSLLECKIRHIPQSVGDKVSYRNFSAGEIDFYDEYINLLIDVNGKTAVTVDTNKLINENESLMLLLAEYSKDGTRLLNLNIHRFAFGESLNGYSMSIQKPSQNVLVKAFLWDKKSLRSYKSAQKTK